MQILNRKFAHSCLMLFVFVIAAPSLKADPWSWLDKPEKQYWSEITINGYGRQIQFTIPDKAKRLGAHVIRMPRLEKGARDQIIEVSPDFLEHPAKRVAGFVWERYWGGFFKKDITDFTFDVWVNYYGYDAGLISMSIEERMQRVRQEFANLYEQSGSKDGADWFFKRLKLHPYESSQPYMWTLENKPPVVKEHEFFRLPITQNHELIFWFYYRQEVQGGRDDPAWLERRRQLARKILDTVRITPDPFELSGELSELD